MPGSSWDHCPENILQWIKKQHLFWVSTAPLSPDGHCNVSPKSIKGTFHLLEGGRECWYEDMTGSGCETICHLRENGRITLLFSAFDGPPRTCRFFGTGTVHEYGTPEYNHYMPGDTRQPGSRSVIKIDVHKVTLSCGYTVPRFQFIEYRDTLKKFLSIREKPDATGDKSIQAFWGAFNTSSLDGLPGLQTAHKTEGPMQSAWGTEYTKVAHPQAHGLPASAGRSLVKPVVPKEPKNTSTSGQVVRTVKMLDSGLISSIIDLDHRILFGLFLGVLFSTVMNRIGIPLI